MICFPKYVDSAALANDIGRFFHRKIINIQADLDAAVTEAQSRVHHDAAFDGDQKPYDFTPLSAKKRASLSRDYQRKAAHLILCQHHWSSVWLTNFCPLLPVS